MIVRINNKKGTKLYNYIIFITVGILVFNYLYFIGIT